MYYLQSQMGSPYSRIYGIQTAVDKDIPSTEKAL
jgi:hypothetical protein